MEKEKIIDSLKNLKKSYEKIERLNNSLDIYEGDYNSAVKKYEEIKEALGAGTFLKAGFFYLLCILSIVVCVCNFFNFEEWLFTLFLFCFVVLFGSLGLLIQTYSYAKHDRPRNLIKASNYWEETCVSLQCKLDECQRELNEAIEEYEKNQFYNEIPEIYRNVDAYDFFISVLNNRRADTEKEMYNLYEEELHRRRTLEIETKKMEELQQIGVRCPNCNSGNCQMMVETKSDSTPFSFGQACCGHILLGPIGLLCGFCGMGTEVKTTTYYKCNSCGAKFNK